MPDGDSRPSLTVVPRPAPTGLPFVHLNLRRNPFGELERSEREQLAVGEVDHLVERLRRPGFAVQLVGDSGRGKTSLLLAIRRHFPGAAYVLVREQERVRVPRSHPLFLDEAHFLASRQRRRVFKRSSSLVLSTHQDLAEELELSGLEVLTVRPAELQTPDLLGRAFERRIAASRRGEGPVPRITPGTIERLIARFGDDVRAMELVLYRRFQELEEVADVRL